MYLKNTKFVIIAVFLVGCSPKYRSPSYTIFSELTTKQGRYKLISQQSQIIDGLEIQVEYQTKKELDDFFLKLNPSSLGLETSVLRQVPKTDYLSIAEEIAQEKRIIAIKKVIRDNGLLNSELMGKLEPYLIYNRQAKISYVKNASCFSNKYVINDFGVNPYNVLGMHLDIFKVGITNLTETTKEIDISKVFLIDNIGNQQQPIGIDFFKSLYIDYIDKAYDKSPEIVSRIQRTLLVTGPIFASQKRKGFLPFHPIAEEADTVKILWLSENENYKPVEWTFKYDYSLIRKKYLNVGLRAYIEIYEGLGRRDPGIKDLMVFSDPWVDINFTDDWGVSGIYIDTEYLTDGVTVYIIGAGNPKAEKDVELISVFFGKQTLQFEDINEITKPIFLEFKLDKYVISL